MNFAETLAYWYFRLNGFFLVENFVRHGWDGAQSVSSADVDLLGIRCPHVYEPVGGETWDGDHGRFEPLKITLNKDY